jgi:hypothetical protein
LSPAQRCGSARPPLRLWPDVKGGARIAATGTTRDRGGRAPRAWCRDRFVGPPRPQQPPRSPVHTQHRYRTDAPPGPPVSRTRPSRRQTTIPTAGLSNGPTVATPRAATDPMWDLHRCELGLPHCSSRNRLSLPANASDRSVSRPVPCRSLRVATASSWAGFFDTINRPTGTRPPTRARVPLQYLGSCPELVFDGTSIGHDEPPRRPDDDAADSGPADRPAARIPRQTPPVGRVRQPMLASSAVASVHSRTSSPGQMPEPDSPRQATNQRPGGGHRPLVVLGRGVEQVRQSTKRVRTRRHWAGRWRRLRDGAAGQDRGGQGCGCPKIMLPRDRLISPTSLI